MIEKKKARILDCLRISSKEYDRLIRLPNAQHSSSILHIHNTIVNSTSIP